MAAVAEISGEAAAANININKKNELETSKSDSEFTVQKLVDMFTKLNPLAKEFFPSYYHRSNTNTDHHHFSDNDSDNNKHSANHNFPNINNRRKKSNFNQGRRRLSGRAFRAQREDSIRRTVYVSDIDQNITEEHLAGLFSSCGQDLQGELLVLNSGKLEFVA